MDFKIDWKGTDGDFFVHRIDATGKIWVPEVHVMHIMQGSLSGTDMWFNNRNVSASTHYGIGKKGAIHQYVRDEDAAWGNGFVTNYNWYGAKKYPNVNPNLYTLSYELEGMSGESPTEEQWAALMYLLNLKAATYNTPKTKDNFIGHYIIDPVNRAGCPGKGFPWVRLYNELGITTPKLTTNMPVLAFGAKGESVVYMQNQLNKKEFRCGIADGDFGKETLKAVINFQKTNNLDVDGVVGPVSWSYLI